MSNMSNIFLFKRNPFTVRMYSSPRQKRCQVGVVFYWMDVFLRESCMCDIEHQTWQFKACCFDHMKSTSFPDFQVDLQKKRNRFFFDSEKPTEFLQLPNFWINVVVVNFANVHMSRFASCCNGQGHHHLVVNDAVRRVVPHLLIFHPRLHPRQ